MNNVSRTGWYAVVPTGVSLFTKAADCYYEVLVRVGVVCDASPEANR